MLSVDEINCHALKFHDTAECMLLGCACTSLNIYIPWDTKLRIRYANIQWGKVLNSIFQINGLADEVISKLICR